MDRLLELLLRRFVRRGTLRFAILNGGSEQQLNAPQLPSNTWVHVAFTLSGTTAVYAACPVMTANFLFYIVVTTATTGTGASGTVTGMY